MLFDLLTPEFAYKYVFIRILVTVFILWVIGRGIRGFIDFILTSAIVAVFDSLRIITNLLFHFIYVIDLGYNRVKDLITGGKVVLRKRILNAEYLLNIAYIPDTKKREELESALRSVKSTHQMNQYETLLLNYRNGLSEPKNPYEVNFGNLDIKKMHADKKFHLFDRISPAGSYYDTEDLWP